MSWIDEIAPPQAEGRLAKVYGHATDPELGRPANVLTVHSLRPAILEAHLALYRRVVKATRELPWYEREAVATTVSACNDCRYCTVHHRVSLVRAVDAARGERPDLPDGRALADALVRHVRAGEELDTNLLGPRLSAMVPYAMALTRAPGAMSAAHLAAARGAGLGDAELLELNQVVAYFNYVNRVVMGLGVELEPEYEADWADLPW